MIMHSEIVGRLADMSKGVYYIFAFGFSKSDPGMKYKFSGFHKDLGIFNSLEEIESHYHIIKFEEVNK